MAAVVLCLLSPWVLAPPLLVQVAVAVVVAAHGYAAGALTRSAVRWLHPAPRFAPGARRADSVRPSRTRPVKAVVVLCLLMTACLSPIGPQPGQEKRVADVGSVRPGSLVPSGTLGPEGHTFLGAVPDPQTIQRVTGRPGRQPLRLYVGMRSAGTDEERARLMVADLDHNMAFTRSTVLVVVPTGSGWVDPTTVGSLEYLTGGDLATVAVQYAQRPSWEEYLLGTERSKRSATTLVAALRHRLDQFPAPSRPRLLVYGESLGAIGARSASSWADETLLVGEPGIAWTQPQPQPQPQPRPVTSLRHTDDPVIWWTPRLLIEHPACWPGSWLPVVSFWQLTGSLVHALDAPAGHGHRYGAELVDAWISTAPDGGTLPPAQLDAVRGAINGPGPNETSS